LPENVKFGVFDCSANEGIPNELVEKDDVIHVEFLALVVKDGNSGVWVENLMSLLSK
jgi:hypothetical protein